MKYLLGVVNIWTQITFIKSIIGVNQAIVKEVKVESPNKLHCVPAEREKGQEIDYETTQRRPMKRLYIKRKIKF